MSNPGAMTVIDDGEASLGPMHAAMTASVSTAIQAMALMADKRIATARMYPRSIARFKKETAQLLREDVETARSAEYAKPVGNGVVRGPSIRLAELVAMCWGNIEVELSEPIVGDKNVTLRATAWDLEKNYRQDGMASISIVDKQGRRYPQHLIETTILAAASKAKRNAIIAVIPRSYIQDLLAVAKEVAMGNKKPLEQQRVDTLDYFARTHKVQPEQVFEFLKVEGIDDMGEEEIELLRGVVTAIKEGAEITEYFRSPAASKAEEVKAKIKARQGKKEPGKEPGKEPEKEKEVQPADGKLFSDPASQKLPD